MKTDGVLYNATATSMRRNIGWSGSSRSEMTSKDVRQGSPISPVGIETGYELDDRGVGVRVSVRPRIFTSPLRPDRL
jgi:hypothetical protein